MFGSCSCDPHMKMLIIYSQFFPHLSQKGRFPPRTFDLLAGLEGFLMPSGVPGGGEERERRSPPREVKLSLRRISGRTGHPCRREGGSTGLGSKESQCVRGWDRGGGGRQTCSGDKATRRGWARMGLRSAYLSAFWAMDWQHLVLPSHCPFF